MTAYADDEEYRLAEEQRLRGHLAENVVPLHDGVAAKPPFKFRREKLGEIEPGSVEWRVKYFMPALGVAILYGASTVGKSFLVLWLCLRIALGKHVMGHRTKQAGALYVAAEGQNGMRKRIKAIREKYGISSELFQFIGASLNLLDDAHVEALITAAQEADEEMRTATGIGLGIIVIDTTSASMPGGNENAGEDMSRIMTNGQKIGTAVGALVMFVAHPGKDETRGVRGWSGQFGNVDAVYKIQKSDLDPKLKVGVVEKLKDGPDGERFAYRLQPFDMGVDEDGDAVTSAYPVFEGVPDEGGGRRRQPVSEKPGPALILRSLHQMLEAGQGVIVPAYPGVPPGTQGVERRALRERAVLQGYSDPDEKPDTIKRSVNRDIQALAAANRIRVEGDYVWPLK
ncbi:MAG: hypothetical protein JWP35_4655 [Caulobacter sp.]|nr:hypothetical protein [Caulobacter sp.]